MKNLNEELSRIKNLMGVVLEQTTIPNNLYMTYVATGRVADLPNIIKTYDPKKGSIKITDGNPWLATQRAKALQQFLIKQFESYLKIDFNETQAKVLQTKVEGKGNEYQYVKATIKGRLRKPPVPQEKYPFDILYNFYDINGVPHILVTKTGAGQPETIDATNGYKRGFDRFNGFLSKLNTGGKGFVVAQNTGGGGAQGPNMKETTFGIMIPIEGGYTAKEKGRLFFNDQKQFRDMANFIAAHTEPDFRSTDDLKDPKSKQINFTSTRGGGGNYIFGDLGSGRRAKILTSQNPEGTDTVIKRMEPSIVGKLEGQVKEGGEEEWRNIDDIFYKDLFHDNMITIKQGSYQDVINRIKEKIDQLRPSFEIIELSADIQGFASTDNANNRCESGVTPDHSWGLTNPQSGPVTPDKWVTKQ
jgi:hypothetical protein